MEWMRPSEKSPTLGQFGRGAVVGENKIYEKGPNAYLEMVY